jgi:hypothetical protein
VLSRVKRNKIHSRSQVLFYFKNSPFGARPSFSLDAAIYEPGYFFFLINGIVTLHVGW